MLDWLINFGTGLPAWTMLVLTVGGLILAVWVIIAAIRLKVSLDKKDGQWKSLTKWLVFKAFVFAVFIFAFFTAFGPGKPPQELPSDIGVMKYVDKAPDMKTSAEIDAEAAAKVDLFLKKQSEGFKAEQEEADAYLDNIRKKHQNQ